MSQYIHDYYEYVEHTTGTIHINILDDTGNAQIIDYELFFSTLNKNKTATKLSMCLEPTNGEALDDVHGFLKHFKIPPNITKLRLPYLTNIPYKLTLPQHIEELTLQHILDIDNIYFTENIELKHIQILDCLCFETYSMFVYFTPIIDLSYVYDLKTIKFAQCSPTEQVNILKKIKLPYGAISEFY